MFPNDVGILKSKVGLGSDHIEIDLRKAFLGKYNSFMNKINYFWKRKATKALGHAYAYTRTRTDAQALRAHARVLETMKGKFFFSA